MRLHDLLFLGIELCNRYNLEAEDFCDQWYAFTISNLNGAAPTVENLEKLERKEYQSSKAKSKIITTPKGKSSTSIPEIDSYPFKIHWTKTVNYVTWKIQFLNWIFRDVNNLVNSYSSGTPKQQKVSNFIFKINVVGFLNDAGSSV